MMIELQLCFATSAKHAQQINCNVLVHACGTETKQQTECAQRCFYGTEQNENVTVFLTGTVHVPLWLDRLIPVAKSTSSPSLSHTCNIKI